MTRPSTSRAASVRSTALAVVSLSLFACAYPTGVFGGRGGGSSSAFASTTTAQPAPGPRVLLLPGGFDTLVSPFPDDRLTVPDPHSPTGRRLRMPLPERTDFERRAKAAFSQMDGFGLLSPVTVTFDATLDLATVNDATAALIDVDPFSPGYGTRVALDLGRGSFRSELGVPVSFYARDPLAGSGDLTFPPGNRAVHHEDSTNTLILRPLAPLAEGTRYVAVLTRDVRGTNGTSIAPPAGFVRDSRDDAALRRAGVDPAEVSFQWSYTTGRPTLELRELARGLDGHGPFAALQQARIDIERIDDLGVPLFDGSPFTADGGALVTTLGAFNRLLRAASHGAPQLKSLADGLELFDPRFLRYVAFGSATGPDLRTGPYGLFDLDLASGRFAMKPGRIPFLLTVPRPCPENGYKQPPYPVVLFGHGNERSRLDGLLLASSAARHGYALLAFDEVGHGPDDMLSRLPETIGHAANQNAVLAFVLRPLVLSLSIALGTPVQLRDSIGAQLETLSRAPLLFPLMHDGRARDVDGDGRTDSGGDFFTVDVFKTRDIIRQTALDAMVLARIVKSLGIDRNGNGSLDPEEGDLDHDGIPDFGGRGSPVHYVGMSLGSIIGGVLSGIDPEIERSVLMVPGGGLSDIIMTSTLGSITGRVFREAFGSVVTGDPDGPNHTRVDHPTLGSLGRLPLLVGDEIVAENRTLGITVRSIVEADRGFRVHIPVNPGDRIDLAAFDGSGTGLGQLAFTAPEPGIGCRRSTPRVREWSGFAQLALEPADAVAFAPHWRLRRPSQRHADVLLQCSIADNVVPVFTGASLGRAASLISSPRNTLLIQSGILRGDFQVNVDRLHGVESRFGEGIRFLGVSSHVGTLIPNPTHPSAGAQYAHAAQAQAFTFLTTGVIDDLFPIFDQVLTP